MEEAIERDLRETPNAPDTESELIEVSADHIVEAARTSAGHFRETVVNDLRGIDSETPSGRNLSSEMRKLVAEAYASLSRLQERVGTTARSISTEISRRNIEKKLGKLNDTLYKLRQETGNDHSLIAVRDKTLILLDQAAGIESGDIRYRADSILSQITHSLAYRGNLEDSLATWENVRTFTHDGAQAIAELESKVKKLPDEKREEVFRKHPDIRYHHAKGTAEPEKIIDAVQHINVEDTKSTERLAQLSIGKYRELPASSLYAYPEVRGKLFEVYRKNGRLRQISEALEIFGDRISELANEQRDEVLGQASPDDVIKYVRLGEDEIGKYAEKAGIKPEAIDSPDELPRNIKTDPYVALNNPRLFGLESKKGQDIFKHALTVSTDKSTWEVTNFIFYAHTFCDQHEGLSKEDVRKTTEEYLEGLASDPRSDVLNAIKLLQEKGILEPKDYQKTLEIYLQSSGGAGAERVLSIENKLELSEKVRFLAEEQFISDVVKDEHKWRRERTIGEILNGELDISEKSWDKLLEQLEPHELDKQVGQFARSLDEKQTQYLNSFAKRTHNPLYLLRHAKYRYEEGAVPFETCEQIAVAVAQSRPLDELPNLRDELLKYEKAVEVLASRAEKEENLIAIRELVERGIQQKIKLPEAQHRRYRDIWVNKLGRGADLNAEMIERGFLLTKDTKEIIKLVADSGNQEGLYYLSHAGTYRALFKDATKKEEVWELVAPHIKNMDALIGNENFRASQIELCELMSMLIDGERSALKAAITSSSAESERITELFEQINNFVNKYKIGEKGRTLVTLIAARNYDRELEPHELFIRIVEDISRYEEILGHYDPNKIPEGCKPSFGVEYEISRGSVGRYKELYASDYQQDIKAISHWANVGESHEQTLHEIATHPTDNPYALLLELKLLQDLGFINFNFDENEYSGQTKGFHFTMSGQTGLWNDIHTRAFQHSLTIAGWGGINAGKEVRKYGTGGTHDMLGFETTPPTEIREKGTGKFKEHVYGTPAPAVEYRALSIDRWEPFERAILASYAMSVAGQAVEKYNLQHTKRIKEWSDFGSYVDVTEKERGFINLLTTNLSSTPEQLLRQSQEAGHFAEIPEGKERELVLAWLELMQSMAAIINEHNTTFYENEVYGYPDEKRGYIEPGDFGGEANQSRFDSVIRSEGVEEFEQYKRLIHLDPESLFLTFHRDEVNALARINNLFLKPPIKHKEELVNTEEAEEERTRKKKELVKDEAVNALAVLKVTKDINTNEIEEAVIYKPETRSIFDKKYSPRQGYYYVQGGSPRMITHASQIALLKFMRKVDGAIRG